MLKRTCGDCQLCCKLLPVEELQKDANSRCAHQRHGKGCSIYVRRPVSCAMWSCRWLFGFDDTKDLRRPDRSHIVIDIGPDFIEIEDNQDGTSTPVEVMQIWCDPKHREAWREPSVLAFIERCAEDNIATLVRFGSTEAVTVFAPKFAEDHQWHELWNGKVERQTTSAERMEGVMRARAIQ